MLHTSRIYTEATSSTPIQLMGLSPTYCDIHGPSISPTRVSSARGPCRVPATRPSGPTARSNSPRYPRRGVLPHAGDCPTLTPPLDGSDEGSTLTTIYHGARSRAPYGPRVHCPLTPLTPPCRTLLVRGRLHQEDVSVCLLLQDLLQSCSRGGEEESGRHVL